MRGAMAQGHPIVDGDVVARLLVATHPRGLLPRLSRREQDVLCLMAQGRSNGAIADALCVTLKTVESHVSSIFTKLDIPDSSADNRRVHAVLAWLQDEAYAVRISARAG